jgi:DNA repair exonuclease SbcCD ATPase subunit/DNA repair exonuclease SbcCD nuclease subunit
MKIVHVSDIHIKNFKYHKQYNEIFESLYEKVREVKPDIIINTGDTAHTKLDLSPSYFEMTAKLFENLANIAPLHVILGNHDLNLSNKDRQDAVTPVVEALKNSNIHLHKYSKKFSIGDFNFHVLSIVDEENWNLDVDDAKTNIALFHGSVEGSQTDMNFTMTHGDIEFSVLEKFDYALLGDIHKTNQALDHAGRCRYPGSLVQQNHGETNDKGFLFWDIQDKETFSVQHIQVENPYPFFTIQLTNDGKLPSDIDVPSNARLRLLSKYNLSPELMKKASDVAKERYKPESISFLARSINKNDDLISEHSIAKENLRSKKVQEKLMKDYLEDYKVPDDILQQVYEINSRYNSVIESQEDVCRNVNWKLRQVEWDNLFNYGENNVIDFDKLSGIVGIFGKNYSGKSSIIDSILYTIFNTTSKNERKTTNVINQTRSYASGKAIIEVDGFEYHINRKAEKYTKKLKGEVSEEAKTELSFNCYDPHSNQWDQMNELSRTDTDKRIRKMFGTIDDFMLTSFSSQLDSMSFIKEGSTRRKEILARFLDLEIFDTKFKMAKEESANLKGLLKKLEGKDYDTEIFTNQTLLSDYQKMIEEKNAESQTLKETISTTNTQISSLQSQINDCGVDSVDVDNLLSQKVKLENNLSSLNNQKTDKETQLKDKQDLFVKIEEFINNFDLQDLKNKKEFVSDKQKQIDDFHEEIVISTRELERIKLRSKLLENIPCGNSYVTSCKLIKDAYDAKMQIPIFEDSIDSDKEQHDKLVKEIEEYDLTKINSQLSKYDQIIIKKAQTEKEVLKLQIDIEKAINDISKLQIELSGVDAQIEQYKKNNELFSKIDELKLNLIKSQNEAINLNNRLTKLDKELKDTYILVGSTTNKIQTLENEKNELEQYRNQFAAYDYFMRCMHSNGISYEIIKKKLPVINSEISKVLSNIVDFEVYFEDDGARLNVFIKHPKYDPRPIEMGSGAEKTIASMAIRLAMLQVSNLPKCNFMVMDEPGTALDSENLEGFIRILEMMKNYYDVVLLISHMDALKDVADTIITIDKKDGYANVRV